MSSITGIRASRRKLMVFDVEVKKEGRLIWTSVRIKYKRSSKKSAKNKKEEKEEKKKKKEKRKKMHARHEMSMNNP